MEAGTEPAAKNANNDENDRQECDADPGKCPNNLFFAHEWHIEPGIFFRINKLVAKADRASDTIWGSIGDYHEFSADWSSERCAQDCSSVVLNEFCRVGSVCTIINVGNGVIERLQAQLNKGRCVVAIFVILHSNYPVARFIVSVVSLKDHKLV